MLLLLRGAKPWLKSPALPKLMLEYLRLRNRCCSYPGPPPVFGRRRSRRDVSAAQVEVAETADVQLAQAGKARVEDRPAPRRRSPMLSGGPRAVTWRGEVQR